MFLLYIQSAVLGFFVISMRQFHLAIFVFFKVFIFLLKPESLYFGIQGGLILSQNPQDRHSVRIVNFGLFWPFPDVVFEDSPVRDHTVNCHTSTRQHGYLKLLQTF